MLRRRSQTPPLQQAGPAAAPGSPQDAGSEASFRSLSEPDRGQRAVSFAASEANTRRYDPRQPVLRPGPGAHQARPPGKGKRAYGKGQQLRSKGKGKGKGRGRPAPYEPR